jgi:hypothetical protein
MLCGIGAGLANQFIAPLFTVTGPTVGASGSVYGILVAFGMMFPNRPIFIYFLFPIKAKYFVILYMVIELMSVGSSTGIAHVAHLGGGVVGFLYIILSGKFNFKNPFQFSDRPKSTYEQPPKVYRNKYYEKYNVGSDSDDVSDADYYIDNDKEDKVSQERIDEILDKISKDGYKSLTEEEKRILFEASKKIH